MATTQTDYILSFYPRHPRGWRHLVPVQAVAGPRGFYPRHPRGWRLLTYADGTVEIVVSIHATLAGGDSRLLELLEGDCQVSIHATLAGGDSRGRVMRARYKGFYPRHPRGWRHRSMASFVRMVLFLSTPPSRVATAKATQMPVEFFKFLSTPPSRVATIVNVSGKPLPFRFYPRHPRGWRPPPVPEPNVQGNCFYPRHPRGWRLLMVIMTLTIIGVSIHATLAGGDVFVLCISQSDIWFLSTPPSRVATKDCIMELFIPSGFYPRHPRGWRPGKHSVLQRRPWGFYPRHPRGWRRGLLNFFFRSGMFLSTPPSRVATRPALLCG